MKQDLEENEYLRFSMFKRGIGFATNRELLGDDLEELLDDEMAAEKDLITLGTGIGAYIASNADLDPKHALASLMAAVGVSIQHAEEVIEKGEMYATKEDDIKIEKEDFNETDYR